MPTPSTASVGVQHLPPYRPWFSLYNVRLKAQPSSSSEEVGAALVNNCSRRRRNIRWQQVELAPIQALIPDELLHQVLLQLPIMDVARTQCVCKHWHQLGEHAELWQQACLATFASTTMAHNAELVRSQYRCGQHHLQRLLEGQHQPP